MSPSLLVAFDFDHTICDGNTDIIVKKLISSDKIPKNVRELRNVGEWTMYMAKIFELLHEHNINERQIKSAISNIPPVAGVEDLILKLHSYQCEIIIISDSNVLFIKTWLMSHKLDHTITQIYTNPAKFDKNGLLKIEMYHIQDWCQLNDKNMCKGHILESHVNKRREQGVTFDNIVYIGDGENDLCPILRLSESDVAFPRLDYVLIKLIRDPLNENAQKIRCNIVPWKSGYDILEELKNNLFFK